MLGSPPQVLGALRGLHRRDTRAQGGHKGAPGDTRKGSWEILWGVTGSKSTAPGTPSAIRDCRGHSAHWGPLGASRGSSPKLTASTRHSLSAALLLIRSLGWGGGVGGSLPGSQMSAHTAPEERVSSWILGSGHRLALLPCGSNLGDGAAWFRKPVLKEKLHLTAGTLAGVRAPKSDPYSHPQVTEYPGLRRQDYWQQGPSQG